MDNDYMPQELDEKQRHVVLQPIVNDAIHKEKDAASKQQLQKAERELAELQERNTELTTRWENEKGVMNRVKHVQEEIDCKQTERKQSQRAGKWEDAARILSGEMSDLKNQLGEAEQQVKQLT